MGSSCSVGFQQVFSPEIPSAVFQRELILIRRESEFANYVCGILCCFSEALAPSLFSAGAKGEQDGGMCSQMLPFMCFSKAFSFPSPRRQAQRACEISFFQWIDKYCKK